MPARPGTFGSHAGRPQESAPENEVILPENLIGMLETLDRGTLSGLRNRAMLLIGFAGGLRRWEIVGLEVGRRPD
jgi:site-specific recombinase XerD